jgi:hypothetical protein
MLSKRTWLVIGIVAVVLIGVGVGILGLNEPHSSELALSDYPEIFKKDAMIIVGGNASDIELESAAAIAANLAELTGNEPIIETADEVSEKDKSGHNLILVGIPNSNGILQEVYDVTKAARVTIEYPGDNKGILEILANPWNSDKALLLVAGSDERGAEVAASRLNESQLLTASAVVVDAKVSGLLHLQIELRRMQIADPKEERLEQMKALGMRVEDLDTQSIFIYFAEEPTAVQVKELQDLGINLYLDSWIPPVGNHSGGFMLADMPIDKLDELASTSYVEKLDTAERLQEPLTSPGHEESVAIIQ